MQPINEINRKYKQNSPYEVYLSVVVPIFNENEGLCSLHTKLENALQSNGYDYEIIYVDDGSTDGTSARLKRIHATSERVKVITLFRNNGQAIALSAGFSHVSGKIVMTMDGDGQMEPDDIPLLIEKIEEGSDVVSGWRSKREDSWFSRALPSKIANQMIKRLTGVPFHDYGCSLKAYRYELVEALEFNQYRTFNQAILIALAGKCAEVKVRHYSRPYGSSKWNFIKLCQFNLDNLVSLSIHTFQMMALICTSIALLGLIMLPAAALLMHSSSAVNVMHTIAMFLILGALGLVGTAASLAGEFVVRIFHLIDRRPKWIAREILEPNFIFTHAVVETRLGSDRVHRP